MLKKTAILSTAFVTMIGIEVSAQTSEPQEPTKPPVVDTTDSVVGYWGSTHAACISYYGSHKPWYDVSMEARHDRSKFVLNGKLREESCRIEGEYKAENNDVSYQIKTQECEISKLSDELKATVEGGQMLISLSSEIADKVCPVRGSTLRIYMIRR